MPQLGLLDSSWPQHTMLQLWIIVYLSTLASVQHTVPKLWPHKYICLHASIQFLSWDCLPPPDHSIQCLSWDYLPSPDPSIQCLSWTTWDYLLPPDPSMQCLSRDYFSPPDLTLAYNASVRTICILLTQHTMPQLGLHVLRYTYLHASPVCSPKLRPVGTFASMPAYNASVKTTFLLLTPAYNSSFGTTCTLVHLPPCQFSMQS